MSHLPHPTRPVLLAAVPFFLVSMLAFAAEDASRGPSGVIFLLQIIVLLACGRLMGEVMQRIGQPPVMGQLIAGILLGPSALGALWPGLQHTLFPTSPDQKAMIDAVAQLGILLLLLLTGMETDLAVVRRSRGAAFSVSFAGIIVPFLCGALLGELLPDAMLPNPEKRLITTLFLGTALSISSVKIVAMVVREVGFLRRTVGQVIVVAASRRPTSIDENDLGVGPSATSDTACATARSAGQNRPPARRSEAVLPSPDTFTALIDRKTGKDGEFDRIQCERER